MTRPPNNAEVLTFIVAPIRLYLANNTAYLNTDTQKFYKCMYFAVNDSLEGNT